MNEQEFTYWAHLGVLSDYIFINPISQKNFLLNSQTKESFTITNGRKINIKLQGVIIPFEFFALEKDIRIEIRTPVLNVDNKEEYILIKEIVHPTVSLSYCGSCDGTTSLANIEIIGDICTERKEFKEKKK